MATPTAMIRTASAATAAMMIGISVVSLLER
jgi:hypothetical protein